MDSQFAEVVKSTNGSTPLQTGTGVTLFVPYNLTKRKIYFYIWGNFGAATDYCIMGTIHLINAAGEDIGKIPVGIGLSAGNGGTVLGQSIASFVNSGGSAMADSLSLILCNPVGNQPTNGTLLQPFNVDSPCSQVKFTIDKQLNCVDARYYLAVISS